MKKILWVVALVVGVGSLLTAAEQKEGAPPAPVPAAAEAKPSAPAPSPEPFGLSVKFNPVRRNIELSVDVIDYWKKDAVKKVAWHVDYIPGIREKALARRIANGEITEKANDVFHALAVLPPKLAEGRYEVEIMLLDGAGKDLDVVRREITKVNEARDFPWWANKIGNTEKVLPPFEPVKYEGGGIVRCWGREYYLDSLGLPRQLSSSGGETLAAPAYVEIVTGGKKATLNTSGTPSFKVKKDYKIEFRGYARSGNLKFYTTGLFEQDGMLKLDLTITARKPTTVDSLALVIPLRKEDAEFMEAHGSPGDSHYTIGAVPKATRLSSDAQKEEKKDKNKGKKPPAKKEPAEKEIREEVVWDSSKNGPSQTGVGTFTPVIWIGNDLRGLLWFADSDKGWVPRDDVHAHEIVRR